MMRPAHKELLQITSQAFAAFLLVLLADAFVVTVAFMFMMGDHADTVPKYNYSTETWFAISILFVYSVIVLSLGIYWRRTRKLTARFVGIILGLSPIIILMTFFVINYYKSDYY